MTKGKSRSLGTFSDLRDQGFTLIELLIVIVILGVLAGITVLAVQNFTGTSIQAACKADYKSVEVAVEAYKAQLGEYPKTGDHGIPLAATDAVPSTTANGLIKGDTFDAPPVGPWLRDQPTNGLHYRIEASTDGSGTVQVYKWDGSATIPAPPGPSPTGTAADCSSVS